MCESFVKTEDRRATAPRLQLSPCLEVVSQPLRVDGCGLKLLDVESLAEEDGPSCCLVGTSIESGEYSLRVGIGRDDLFDDEALHGVVEDDDSSFMRGVRVWAVGRGVDRRLLEEGAGTWYAGKIGPGCCEGRWASVVSGVTVVVAFHCPASLSMVALSNKKGPPCTCPLRKRLSSKKIFLSGAGQTVLAHQKQRPSAAPLKIRVLSALAKTLPYRLRLRVSELASVV